MKALPDEESGSQKALRSAEAALVRIKHYAEAARDEHITPGEALEQILDELEARPALGRVRRALSRSFDPRLPN